MKSSLKEGGLTVQNPRDVGKPGWLDLILTSPWISTPDPDRVRRAGWRGALKVRSPCECVCLASFDTVILTFDTCLADVQNWNGSLIVAVITAEFCQCITACQTPQVTRAFSFSKTPKRALRRALMSHSATEGRSPSSVNESYVGSRLTSTSSLAVSDSAVQAK